MIGSRRSPRIPQTGRPSPGPPRRGVARAGRVARTTTDRDRSPGGEPRWAAAGSSRPITPGTKTSRRRPVDPHSDALIRSIGPDKGAAPRLRHSLSGHTRTASPTSSCRATNPRSRSGSTTPRRATPARIRSPPTPRSREARTAQGDRHVLVVDRDHWKLYELFRRVPTRGGLAARLAGRSST